MNQRGEFIWYELLTNDCDAAIKIYGSILGWQTRESIQQHVDYRICRMEDDDAGEAHDVCGLLQLTDGMIKDGVKPVWLGYIGVEDVDQSASDIVAAGGSTQMPPTSIANIGRLAMVTDPQGVPFYVMRGLSNKNSLAFASDRPRIGHCAWNELITSDPESAKAFYFNAFGWTKDGEMDIGPMGSYEFIRHNGIIGAIMPKPKEMKTPIWHYYFRCADIGRAAKTITELGGHIEFGPDEIPGGDFILKGIDPQGALFALIGSNNSQPQ